MLILDIQGGPLPNFGCLNPNPKSLNHMLLYMNQGRFRLDFLAVNVYML